MQLSRGGNGLDITASCEKLPVVSRTVAKLLDGEAGCVLGFPEAVRPHILKSQAIPGAGEALVENWMELDAYVALQAEVIWPLQEGCGSLSCFRGPQFNGLPGNPPPLHLLYLWAGGFSAAFPNLGSSSFMLQETPVLATKRGRSQVFL